MYRHFLRHWSSGPILLVGMAMLVAGDGCPTGDCGDAKSAETQKLADGSYQISRALRRTNDLVWLPGRSTAIVPCSVRTSVCARGLVAASPGDTHIGEGGRTC